MLENYLEGTTFKEQAASWQEAITIAAQPLLKAGAIEERYIDAMIQNVLENGNYIIILPEIAMPHARHEYGSLKTGISFMKLEQPVYFPEEQPVKLFFVLASDSDDGHLDLIASLGELLSDEDVTNRLLKVQDEQELLAVIKGY